VASSDIFAQSPQLARLDAVARASILANSSRFTLDTGEVLFRQGDVADALYILGSGRLGIETRLPGDDSAALSPILPGEVVGEFALLDDAPRSARVTALLPSEGLRISRARFHALLADAQPGTVQLAASLRRLVATRTRATLARIAAEGRFEPSSLRRANSSMAEPVPVAGDAAALVAGLGKLAELAADGARALTAPSRMVGLERGRGLVRVKDDTPNALWIVLRGALRASMARPDGAEQISIHGPGECVNVTALEDGAAAPLDVAAAEDCVLLRVPGEVLAPVLDPDATSASDWHGALAMVLGRQLVRDQRRANRHLGRALALERFNSAGAGVLA
jgi:CRP/FNR family cyclic AMP-dependent transcriptional regulator